MKYGLPPIDLGKVELSPKEMMFWLYCPIKLANDLTLVIPPNLRQFEPIIERIQQDCSFGRWRSNYVYLTAKTLWITPDNPGNRPGWHSDGFMTTDLNYIWSDTNGTLFWTPDKLRDFTQDHAVSLAEMEMAAGHHPCTHRVYPDKHLLRLDETVIHRVNDVTTSGYRSFVKVSISEHKYNLIGNSINHEIEFDRPKFERTIERNHPQRDFEDDET